MNKPETSLVITLDLIKAMRYTELTHFPDDANLTAQFRVRTRTWQVLTHEGFIGGNGTYVAIPFVDWIDDNGSLWSELPDDIESFMCHMVEDFNLGCEDEPVIWEITW